MKAQQKLTEALNRPCKVTLTGFISLQHGDNYQTVSAKLGCYGTRAFHSAPSSYSIDSHYWDGVNGGRVDAAFEDGKLYKMIETGLD